MESSTYDNFAWKQTQPGRWEREIDEVEQFYATLSRIFQGTGRTFFAITAHVSLSIAHNFKQGSRTELHVIDALRSAWLRLRYDHPTIASWVEENHEQKRCKKVYEAFSDVEDDPHLTWLKETFHVISTSQSGQQWCNSDPPLPRLPTIFLLKHPPKPQHNVFRVDVVLRSHHDVIDGIGSLHLLNNLIKYASQALDHPGNWRIPEFTDEWKNLSPPFRVAADIPEVLSPDQDLKLKSIVESNDAVREGVEIATLPFKLGPTVPGCHKRVSVKVPTADTEKLLLACRQIGASLTHAYHAALALVIRDAQQKSENERKVRYISYTLINERGHCKAPYNSPQHAVSVYHSVSGRSLAIDLTVPGLASPDPAPGKTKDDFIRTVEDVKRYYLSIREDEEHISFVPSYWQLSTPPYPPGLEDPPIPPPNEKPSASISSLGVIDSIITPTNGKFEVNDPWVSGEELGTGLGIFLGTYRGILGLSAAYNDAWHNEVDVREFLHKCHSVVVNNLLSSQQQGVSPQ
ncbi:hypothetical protein MYU51_007413 [Penicillium brevicompactum]|uniref:uncharacterized protein n=1 Tax=Penicillium brevicompactum TaxID=5074 RepID=UPI002540BB12|nr:uncharacterized protein N7506_006029 [Penicillium brevicompactum]KAJ5332246.1 hypothetical protein N7506_006029 [Penicillium brevicompactum]